ncbi:DNA repair nucleotidyltransferase/DNA polymerase-like protein [Haliangium ochraceum]|uniref:Nucleotidyltransferase/DNA polymerase involved in DNA repair-like protein n=1 Tax=Haliangium ochraceum (strain DSM 14365 / JCM 11303 / SMP-2) TaxID=502025 RepID=D0LTL3_HALO1|nr:DNA repair nucleotidyltransferase/DNA polymerase-like protein [Haliangium ochraceum]ACY15707.1 Nucleotidyltransferase/DNA polymerase involved in DNA repair-like protein [Haliangium ochraceum DSM 14365]
MDRTACVDLPAFPLQLLRQRHPEWAGHPVVIVDEDAPQGRILWADERARERRILPGQRYAHALSLAPDLHAGVIDEREIAAGVDAVCELLREFSPEIEPCADLPGVFWLDGAGLERLFRSLRKWARGIERALRERGYEVALAVGFTRFGSYAVARGRPRALSIFDDRASEHAAARDVALERLGVDPQLREHLRRLGVVTVGEFLHLPAGGILERFGAEAHRIHRLAAGESWDPLRPTPAPEPLEECVLFDDPERNTERLLYALEGALTPLLDRLAKDRCALTRLAVELTLDDAIQTRAQPRTRGRNRPSAHVEGRDAHDHPVRVDAIRPAEPTLELQTVMRLVRLRFEAEPPRAAVRELRLRVGAILATREQLELFAHAPRRDLRAANEALARLRAELGDHAVVKASLREGHLPEARYAWEPLRELRLPQPAPARAESDTRPLIRRIWARPRILPPQEHRFRDDGWLLGGVEQGPVVRVVGPYVISGGWWAGEVHREYHYAETRRGDLLWVFYDRRRRRWFHHGRVE